MSRIDWDRSGVEYKSKPLRVTAKARFGSRCPFCGRHIEVGSPIASLLEAGQRLHGHESCVYGRK